MQADDENALVRRVAQGDRDAFRTLVDCHQGPLGAYAQRMLNDRSRAEDVVQETLLRLWSQARRFRPERARLTTWLHNIAHNLCIDVLRRESRLQPEEHDEAPADIATPDEVRDGERREVLLHRAIAALPERQRSALVLCHYQGLSNRQAAEILDVRVEALESLLARARRTLKKEFKDYHAS